MSRRSDNRLNGNSAESNPKTPRPLWEMWKRQASAMTNLQMTAKPSLIWTWVSDTLDTGWRAETSHFYYLVGSDDEAAIYALRMSRDEQLANENIGFRMKTCRTTEAAMEICERWHREV